MAYYVVSGKQLSLSISIISLFVTASAAAGLSFMSYREIPEVHVDLEGKCSRVVNFKNGDGFICQDRDVTLRRYRVIPSEQALHGQ